MQDPKPSPFKLNRTRVFILVFFGIALVLSVTTILGTWRGLAEQEEAAGVETTTTP